MSSDLQPLYSLLEEVQTRKSAILLSRPARTDPADFHRYLDHLTVHGSELGDPTRLVDQCIRQAEPDVQALVHSLFEEEQQRWSRAERLLSHRAERPLSPSAPAPAPARPIPVPATSAPATARPVRPRPPQLATERRAQQRRRPPQVRTAPIRHGDGRAANTERVQRTGPSPGTAVHPPAQRGTAVLQPDTAAGPSPPVASAAVCLSRPRHLADTARAALGTPGVDLRPTPLGPPAQLEPQAPLAQPVPPAPRPPPVLAYEEFETVRRLRRVTQPPLPPPSPPPPPPPPPQPLEDDGVRHVHLGLDVSSDASDESEPPPPHGVEGAVTYQQELQFTAGKDEPAPEYEQQRERQDDNGEDEHGGDEEGGAAVPPRPPTSVGADSEPPTPRPPAPAEQGGGESGMNDGENAVRVVDSGSARGGESGGEAVAPAETGHVDLPPPPPPQSGGLATGRHRTANTTPGSALPRPTATAFSKRRAGPSGDAVWSSVPASAASNRRPVVLRSARSVGGSATQWRDGPPPPPPPPSTRAPGSSGPRSRRDVISSDVTWVPMDANVFCSVGRQRTSREMKKKLEINAYKLIQEVCAASLAGGASPPGSSRSEDGSGSSRSGGRRTARSPAAVAADAVAAELDRALADRRLPVAQYSWASSHSDSVSPSADAVGGAAPPAVAAAPMDVPVDAVTKQQRQQQTQQQQQQQQLQQQKQQQQLQQQQQQQQRHQQHEERQVKQHQERQPTNRQRQQRQEQEQKQELHASQLPEERRSRSRSPPLPQKSLPPELSEPSDTTSEATDPSSKPSPSAPSPPPPLSWSAAGDSDCRPPPVAAAASGGPASPGDGDGGVRSPGSPGGGGGGGVPLMRQAPVGGSGHHSAAETDDQVSELESSVVESPPEEARRAATATAMAAATAGGAATGVYQRTVIQPPAADDCFSALPPSGLRSNSTATSSTSTSSSSSTSTSRTPPRRTVPTGVPTAVPTALPTAAARTLPVAPGRFGPVPTPLAPPMKPARAVRTAERTEMAAQTSDSLLPPTAASQHSTDSSAELLSGCCQTTPPPSAASAACQTRSPASPQRRQAGCQTAPTAEPRSDSGERLSLSPSPPGGATGRPPAAVACWRSQSGTSGLGPTASVEDLSEGEVLFQWPHWVGHSGSVSSGVPPLAAVRSAESDCVRPTEQDGADTTLSEGEVTGVTGDTLPVGSSFPSIGTLGPTASQLSVGRRRSSQLTTVPSQVMSVPSHLSVGQRQSNQLKTVSSGVATVPSRVTTVPSQSSTGGQVRSADSVSASASRRASSGRVIGAARVGSSLHLSSVRTEQLSERPVPTGEERAGQDPPDLSDGEMSGSVRVRHVHIRPVRAGDVAGGQRRAIDGAAASHGPALEEAGAESEGALWSDGEAPPDVAV